MLEGEQISPPRNAYSRRILFGCPKLLKLTSPKERWLKVKLANAMLLELDEEEKTNFSSATQTSHCAHKALEIKTGERSSKHGLEGFEEMH